MSRVPLSPRGTAVEAFLRRIGSKPQPADAQNPVFPFELFKAIADFEFDASIVYLAWELARGVPGLSAADQRALVFLLAALFLAEHAGSTLLPLEPAEVLDQAMGQLHAREDDRTRVRALLSPKGLKRLSGLVGAPGEYRPLVLEGSCLYLQRLHEFEGRLVSAVQARASADALPRPGGEAALKEVLAHPAIDGEGRPVRLSAEQQQAALRALELPLTVVTGGPGTGKTSIVVTLLRLLVRLGVPPERIALAAPTGKAANRMGESVGRAMESLVLPSGPDRLLAASLPEPRTLHRLLGYSPGRDVFAHHQGNPLTEEVVIVDEGSMIDLLLMDRLVRAVRPQAQLVLLGDADQLPSVHAGAVFRDLVPGDSPDPFTPSVAPQARSRGAPDHRNRHTVRLTQGFRMAEAKNLQAVADRVKAGDSQALLGPGGLLQRKSASELAFQGVELLPCATAREREAFFDLWALRRLGQGGELKALLATSWRFEQGAIEASQAPFLARLRQLLESSRILCVTRSDARPTGAAAANRALKARWRAALGQPEAKAPFAPGEPVMMLKNDYGRGLFNGDQGLVLAAGEEGALRAVFPRSGGFGLFPADDAEVGYQHSFAMTVHKAQGSEYEQVALMLPDEEGHPLLTREVLYTALTRARRSVVIVGRPEVLAGGVAAKLERHSGIGSRLATS